MKIYTYYHTCPVCGANLDPGEKCDCSIRQPPEVGRERQSGKTALPEAMKKTSPRR